MRFNWEKTEDENDQRKQMQAWEDTDPYEEDSAYHFCFLLEIELGWAIGTLCHLAVTLQRDEMLAQLNNVVLSFDLGGQ